MLELHSHGIHSHGIHSHGISQLQDEADEYKMTVEEEEDLIAVFVDDKVQL